MEIKTIAEECIKPSSPTPLHLKTYRISLLDQFVPPIYVPLILFYPNQHPRLATDDAISKRTLILKQSLSETLTHFYPLAGRIKDFLSIDCNDEGSHYVQARVNISLSEYLNHSDLASILHKLSPQVVHLQSDLGSYVAMIQETTFACGGFAIGVSIFHMFMDGKSMSSFIRHWSAIASESSEAILCPKLDVPSFFPQYDSFSKESCLSSLVSAFVRVGKVGARRLRFEKSAIDSLKAKAISSNVENPTGVEVVSALLLKCIVAVYRVHSGLKKPTLSIHSVNLRRRAVPEFPESSIGNMIWHATALANPEEIDLLSASVCLLRNAFGKLDSEFVKEIQGDGGFLKLNGGIKEMANPLTATEGSSSRADYVTFTSWCNFGLYDVDFGWGKPVWTTCVGPSSNGNETPFMNSVLLMDAKTTKGIEVWVFLSEADLQMLEKDEELLTHASLNPTPMP